jgi:isoquinoline 1-oxidoreductase beta subunit
LNIKFSNCKQIYEKIADIFIISLVKETIYGPYKMALMKHAPKEIDVAILENSDTPSGVGEPPIGPIGAAIANAVFAATGKRLRNLPLAEELGKVS